METTPKVRTCTDVLVEAMEHADNMQEVVVIYRLKSDTPKSDGVGWIGNPKFSERIGLIEEAKFGMFAHVYGMDDDR